MVDIFVIVVSFAFTSAIWVAIIKIFGQGYLDKLNRDWKTKQEKENIEFRSTLKREEDILLNLQKIYKSSNDEIQKKRISAASELWEFAMEIKDTTSPLLFYSIMLDSEISDPKNKTALFECIKRLPKHEDFLEKLESLHKKDIKLKPFINDEIWKIYHIYIGFILRIMFEAYDAARNNKEIPNWKKNENTKKLLKLAFNDDDLEFVYQTKLGSWNIIFAYLEERMITEMNRLFSGEFILRDQKELLKKVCEEVPNNPVAINDLMDKYKFQLLKQGFV